MPKCNDCGETLPAADTTWQQWQCACCGGWNDHATPKSPTWHGERAEFWREEVERRKARLQVAREELEAAQRAVDEHVARAAFFAA